MMKRFAILTVFVFMFSVISVSMVMAQAKPAAKEPIKFGAIYDFAGGCHMYSESAMTGIKLAVEEINAAGGIKSMGGAKIQMLYADSESKPEKGVAEADVLVRAFD
jgi:branched-chain amino acid transport system substrate-binding protein